MIFDRLYYILLRFSANRQSLYPAKQLLHPHLSLYCASFMRPKCSTHFGCLSLEIRIYFMTDFYWGINMNIGRRFKSITHRIPC